MHWYRYSTDNGSSVDSLLRRASPNSTLEIRLTYHADQLHDGDVLELETTTCLMRMTSCWANVCTKPIVFELPPPLSVAEVSDEVAALNSQQQTTS